MLQSVLHLIPDTAPSLLGPTFHSGIWFYLLVFLVILIAAVFVVTPVPDQSILFLAGAMAVNNQVSLAWVLVASIAGAYVGYDLNYWSGRLFSLVVCRRACPYILSAKNILRARALLDRFGPLSVVISRFIPAVNLPPFFAGLESMDYGRYMVANLAGAVLWCGVTVILGYFVGSLGIIQDYVNLLLDLVILATIAAIGYAAARFVWERARNRENTG
ncbi:MAG TPA: DedA family protein [Methanomicrobiales archaeon]|nr:DedA family protein [Methanomicrobiales archaeon]